MVLKFEKFEIYIMLNKDKKETTKNCLKSLIGKK